MKLIIFLSIMSLSYSIDFNMKEVVNPNGKVGLMTVGLAKTGIAERYSLTLKLPVRNWLTLNLQTHDNYTNGTLFRVEAHLPLYKLFK